ncbi:MAG TPA: tetratricopeptide repeat protein [Rubricoccaceae bacterium]|nr:tetratricopeptide repeat protein [Rubricoccaceae bacterium]
MSQIPPTGPATADHEITDFQQDVIEASRRRPVLVDFWAPWCGPCLVLGPVLERLAAAAGDRWALAKVNTDEHPELMQRYGIRGIPAVKLFVDGAVAAEFTGALPEYAVRQWLDEHLPSAAKEHLARARAALASGDRAAARAAFEAVLAEESEGSVAEEARLGLARLVVFDDPARADQLAAGLFAPEAEPIRHLAALLQRDAADLPEGPVRDRYADALAALASGDFDAALGGFIAVLQRDRAYDDDGARKAAVALFQVLGEDDPVVKKHRPVFNMSLY